MQLKTEVEVRRDTLLTLTDDLCAYYETLEYIDAQIAEIQPQIRGDDQFLDAMNGIQKQRREILIEIEHFSDALAKKTDNCADVIRRLETEALFCQQEEQRLAARKRRLMDAQKALKSYIAQTMLERNIKQLKTATNTISVQRSGGLQKLDVTDPNAVDSEHCQYVGKLSFKAFRQCYQFACDLDVRAELEQLKREPDTTSLRRALAVVCDECDGEGSVTDTADTGLPVQCNKCQGSGHASVHGARLEPRGYHIRLT